MVGPATYYGYDKDGNCVAHGTAEDAGNYINPEEIAQAINNLATVMTEQINNIARLLTQVGEDSRSAIVVQGASMGGTLDELNQIIMSLPEQLLSGIEVLYDNAKQAKSACQQQLNSQIYNSVASYSGVVRVG